MAQSHFWSSAPWRVVKLFSHRWPEQIRIFIIEMNETQIQANNMSTTKDNRVIQPYLFFTGSCEEALEFYRKALGAEVQMLMRFKESPEPCDPGMVPPGWEN